MAECSYCQERDLLPFTCSYCNKKFCRIHRLPEKHGCKEVTREKLRSKKLFEKSINSPGSLKTDQPDYKKVYEIPGVMEVIKGKANLLNAKSSKTHFDVDEKGVPARSLQQLFCF